MIGKEVMNEPHLRKCILNLKFCNLIPHKYTHIHFYSINLIEVMLQAKKNKSFRGFLHGAKSLNGGQTISLDILTTLIIVFKYLHLNI